MKTPKFLPIVSLFLGLSLNAGASSATWTGGTGDTGTVWANNSNWSAAYPQTTSDVATFSSTYPTGTISLGQNITVSQLTLSGTGSLTIADTTTLTFASTGLSSSSSAIITNGAENLTLNVNTAFSGSSAAIYLGTGSLITVGASGTATLTLPSNYLYTEGTNTGTITIGSGVTIVGAGSAFRLTNPNAVLNLNTATFSGSFNSAGAILAYEGTVNLGIGQSQKITIGTANTNAAVYLTASGLNDTGQVYFQGSSSNTGDPSLAVYTLGINVTGVATGTFTTGAINLDNAGSGNNTDVFYANTSNTLTINNSIGGSSTGTLLLQKTGAGTVILGHANTFVAATSVTAGTLQLNSASALADATLATGGGGAVTLSGITTLTLGGLSGSQNLSGASGQITSGYTGTVTALTLQPQTGVSDTYSGTIADGHSGMTLTISGAGTQTLSGSNTYTGGTTVSTGGTLVVANTNGSATGSGAVTVNAGATLAGTGSITATGGNAINATGTGTGSSRANIAVGVTSLSDVTTTGNQLSLNAGGGLGLTYANLSLNLSSSSVGTGNTLQVGTTAVSFSSTLLTLNLAGGSIIPADSSYALIVGMGGSTSNLASAGNPNPVGTTTGQFAGLTTEYNSQGLIEIVGSQYGGSSPLTLAFGTALADTYYGNGSYLYISDANGVDEIEVEVIPEPSTWAMMLGGLAVLVFWQRRRNGLD